MDPVEAYYDANAELEWQRCERHRLEFAITRRTLARWLPFPPAPILDCGGGPGRYALHLATRGYPVSLLDLSQANLELARRKAAETGLSLAELVHGNALDLSCYPDGHFAAVLLLGPLYHLMDPADRRQALAEAQRVLRPGGILLAGFITLYAPLRDAIAKGYLQDYAADPTSLEALLISQSANAGFTQAWFARPEEVTPMMEAAGLHTLDLLGVEGLAAGHEQHLNALNESDFDFWVSVNERFCRDPHLLGAADHLLYVGNKPAA